MGVGNIAGVATALTLGGPGSILWMWISSFFGMMTKYAEIFLAVRYRKRSPSGGFYGGPMYYMEQGLGMPWLGGIFAVLCALASFGVGNMAQVNSVSAAAKAAFDIPPWFSGVVVAIIVMLVIFGGAKRIARIAELTIPFITMAYIACAVTALLRNASCLNSAFGLIFEEAFSLKSATGGALGHGIASAVRYGVSRGIFTNEAGMGSASIAHAAADCKTPAHQSAWGIFEVCLDTNIVCTLTGLVLLTAEGGALWQSGLDGVDMTTAAFVRAFGPLGADFIAISVMVFAVAGMLGWCFYGETAIGYLTGRNETAIFFYRSLFVLCSFAGAVGNLRAIWGISDILNGLLVIPNIAAIWLLRREITVPLTDGGRRRWHRMALAKQ